MLAEAASTAAAGSGAGALLAVLCAVLFAVGAVLQHEAAEGSTSASGLRWRRLVTKPKWVVGQLATASGTGLQVAALALAPVAVVQPVLAVGLVVALAIRAVRHRTVPLKAELLGAALTTGGLAVFLVAARPAAHVQTHQPSTLGVLAAVAVSVVLVVVATLLGRGAHGALACGAAAGSHTTACPCSSRSPSSRCAVGMAATGSSRISAGSDHASDPRAYACWPPS